MELYTLDSLLRRTTVIDKYESLIWTERYSAYGDFQLKIASSVQSRAIFTTGVRLAINESYRVMTVETVENHTDAEGKNILTVTGRSLEQILEERIAKNALTPMTSDAKWLFNDYVPGAIARHIFEVSCTVSAYNVTPWDPIPFYTPGNIFPDDTIPEPADPIDLYEVELVTAYKAIKDVCDLYDLGFRLVRNFDTSQLYFNIYTGSDRTTLQTILPAVVFSQDLDNLQNTTELTTTAPNRNCAYVFSPVGFEIVYPIGVDPEVEGFERRVLLVKADDIEDPDPAVASAQMIQRGLDELTKNRSFYAFDGELTQNSAYKYGVDYNLGDIVEQRSADGLANMMRVTEQIFVSDAEGERSYPTLAINLIIEPGSWLAWDYSQVWEDLGLTEYWADA